MPKLRPELLKQRTDTDRWQAETGRKFQAIYPGHLDEQNISGVPVLRVSPPATEGRGVLINLHGGGFVSDSGTLTETVPVAALTKREVYAVRYRLSPENPFPAALEDAIAVYRAMLAKHPASEIIVFGTSAGAILTAELAVKLKALGLPLPAALGIFSGMGDLSTMSDSYSLFALDGSFNKPPKSGPLDLDYVGSHDPHDPILSPQFADLHGLPPTLFLSSTHDLLLSGTVNLHRAYLDAGVPAELVVYDRLGHAFWNDPALPETKDAHRRMAQFFTRHLPAAAR
jgi:epsilon-lactone hydrolase